MRLILLYVCLTSSLANAAGLGSWGPLIQFPLVPAAGAVTPDGKLLTWAAYAPNAFGEGANAQTVTATYDPATGSVSQATVTNTGHDMFCPGISIDFDGRPVVTGGDTTKRTSIYTSSTSSWTSGGDMTLGRGYQASATCSDGRIFTIGGSWSGGTAIKNGEIFNPKTNSWSSLPGCPVTPMLTNDAQGLYRADNHGWFFGWKNGYVFQAGPSKAMNWYGTSGSGSQAGAGTRASDSDSMNGNAIMYDATAGKILTVGGSPSYQDSSASNRAHIITIGTPPNAPSVQAIAPMAFARAFHNSVVLPSGEVLVTGGQSYPVPFSDANATTTPEIWSPVTGLFTPLATEPTPRTYHSIALLMPDATVFSGGGGLCPFCSTNHFDGQFFSPPYLFGLDGKTPATRPIIKSVSATTVRLGGTIQISMSAATKSFSIIRLGSATHSTDTDQRRALLGNRGTGGTNYAVSIPSDSGSILPGYWMLFALNSAGTPSIAKIIKITL